MKHKKLVSVLAIAVLSATFVFAIDLSAGGGFDFSYLSQSVKTSGSPFPGVEINGKYSMSMMQMGVNGFFDAQYVTAKLGIAFNVGNPKISYSITQKALGIENTKSDSVVLEKTSFTYLDFALLGKYPFKVGIAKIYPLLGFDFRINVSAKYDGEDIRQHLTSKQKDALNQYYFVLGLGSDIYVMDKLFIRPMAMFGIQMNSPVSNSSVQQAVAQANALGLDVTVKDGFNYMINAGLSVGYQIK